MVFSLTRLWKIGCPKPESGSWLSIVRYQVAGMSGNMVRTLKTATIIGQEINFAPRCRAKKEKNWKVEVKIREFEAFPREGFR